MKLVIYIQEEVGITYVEHGDGYGL